MKAIRKNARKETIKYNIYEYTTNIKRLEYLIKEHEKLAKTYKKEIEQDKLKLIELKQLLKTTK